MVSRIFDSVLKSSSITLTITISLDSDRQSCRIQCPREIIKSHSSPESLLAKQLPKSYQKSLRSHQSQAWELLQPWYLRLSLYARTLLSTSQSSIPIGLHGWAHNTCRKEMKILADRCYYLLLILQQGSRELEQTQVTMAANRTEGSVHWLVSKVPSDTP